MRRLLAQLTCTALLSTTGCLTHRSHQWDRGTSPSPSPAPAPSVVIVGEAGAPGRTPAQVARGVAETLEAERAAGRAPVVVWLGDLLIDARGKLDCSAAAAPWDRAGVDALSEVVRSHVRDGGSAYALPGEAAYRCGAREALRTDTRRPAAQPGTHFVVDVLPSSATRVAATCSGGACSALAQAEDARLQLVFVDLTPWIAGSRPPATDEDLLSLEALMRTLRDAPGPPRVLVSNYPVEAVGFHGNGGGDPDSSVHTLAPPVTEALEAGVFVGALAGHDRATYACDDISDGTIRSNRVFLPHRVFQVVSGAASDPDVYNSWRRLRFNSSIALLPTRYTPRAGFAVVHFGEQPHATLHAYWGGRWQTSSVALSLAPDPRPALVRVPSTAPCLRCPVVPYNER
ncbi:MAG: hypothetical protein ACE37F_27625 [Nannocystaceae bacterium]|nr:hypothetical protein [bacterium]